METHCRTSHHALLPASLGACAAWPPGLLLVFNVAEPHIGDRTLDGNPAAGLILGAPDGVHNFEGGSCVIENSPQGVATY